MLGLFYCFMQKATYSMNKGHIFTVMDGITKSNLNFNNEALNTQPLQSKNVLHGRTKVRAASR